MGLGGPPAAPPGAAPAGGAAGAGAGGGRGAARRLTFDDGRPKALPPPIGRAISSAVMLRAARARVAVTRIFLKFMAIPKV
jgi:hypothetical protein